MTSEHLNEPLDYLYEELPPDKMAEARKHLAECPKCREEMRGIRDTVKAYRQAPRPAPPTGLAARTAALALAQANEPAADPAAEANNDAEFERLKQEILGETRNRFRSWFFHPGWAAAASVMLGVTILIHFSPRNNRWDSHTPSPIHEPAPRHAPAEPMGEALPVPAAGMPEAEPSGPEFQPRPAVVLEAEALEQILSRDVLTESVPPPPTPAALPAPVAPPASSAPATPLDSSASEDAVRPPPPHITAPALESPVLKSDTRPRSTGAPRESVSIHGVVAPEKKEAVVEAMPAPATLSPPPPSPASDSYAAPADEYDESAATSAPPEAGVRDFRQQAGFTGESRGNVNAYAGSDAFSPPAYDASHAPDRSPPDAMWSASSSYQPAPMQREADAGTLFDDSLLGGMEPPQVVARPTPIDTDAAIHNLIMLLGTQISAGDYDEGWETIRLLRAYDSVRADEMANLLREVSKSGAPPPATATAPDKYSSISDAEAFSPSSSSGSYGSGDAAVPEPENTAPAEPAEPRPPAVGEPVSVHYGEPYSLPETTGTQSFLTGDDATPPPPSYDYAETPRVTPPASPPGQEVPPTLWESTIRQDRAQPRARRWRPFSTDPYYRND